jgi:hypothetical protein
VREAVRAHVRWSGHESAWRVVGGRRDGATRSNNMEARPHRPVARARKGTRSRPLPAVQHA